MHSLRYAFCVFLSLLIFVPGLATPSPKDPLNVELPELEVVSGANWYWVSQHMAVNNIPMSIKMFSYPGKPEDVRAFYSGVWKVKGHGTVTQKTIGDMSVLGYQLDGFQYSVQFSRQGEVVDGKIVVTPTPLNYRESKDTTLPLPPRAKVSSVVRSLDGGTVSESVTFETSLGVPHVVDFYMVQLRDDGWVQYSGSGDRTKGAVVSFQRGGELLQLNIKGLQGSNSSFSQVLINWVK